MPASTHVSRTDALLCDRRVRKLVRLAVLLLYLATLNRVEANDPLTITSPVPTGLRGVWKQEDDGRYLRISENVADFYHHSPSICYRDVPASGKPLQESYAVYALSDDDRTLRLWRWDFGARCERQYYEEFQRIDELPSGYVEDPASDGRFEDPKFVFGLICEQFDEHFPHFARRGFDWEGRKRAGFAQIHSETTDRELFQAVCTLLEGLGDSHTRLYWSGEPQAFKSGRALVLDYLDTAFSRQTEIGSIMPFRGHWHGRLHTAVEEQLVSRPIRKAANGRFRWGILPHNVGYIENDLVTAFSPTGAPRSQEIAFLEAELDRMLAELSGCRALVLDLAFNQGGYDPASMMIASRFADQRREVMTRVVGNSSPSRPRSVFVSPRGPHQFTKPVFVVTSNSTVSAGEALVLMLKAFPHVTQVGEPTRGCLSSILNKWMPNGFHLTLSNEVYEASGTIAEGRGIVPEISFPVFDQEDLFGSYPAAIREAAMLAAQAQ